jgi:DNA-binding NarL/FixJ family response regulator
VTAKLEEITVLLADDHTIVREGLRLALEAEKDIRVVAQARSGREAVELVKKLRPDVIVMDIAMPLLNGFEATRQIVKSFPAARILILSAHNDDEYIDQMVAIGASGYLIKQSSTEVLSRAIREIDKGNSFFSPEIAKRLESKNRKTQGRDGSFKKKNITLSSREAEVLQLIAEGKANKEMAAELEISIKTVEKHRQHLMEKLNIHDTAGLTRYAIAAGIIESSVQVTIR